MKLPTLAVLAGTAAAFVIPDEPTNKQLRLSDKVTSFKEKIQDASQGWWDSVPDGDTILSTLEEAATSVFENSPLGRSTADFQWGGGHHGRGPHGDPSKTLYELIKECKYTSNFSALVDEHDDIKALLQDTSSPPRTLFVPTNRAFSRIPSHHRDKKPPKEFILALLKYHLAPGLYPLTRLTSAHTIPTTLRPHDLGNHPQRLRIHTRLFRVFINLFSRVVAADVVAKNGVIHAVDGILIPPPSQEKIVQLLPSVFSTFRLGMETTGLGAELDEREKGETERNGGTLFAPTNRAFARLGPRANAFLFSDYGKKYLKALLKYHVVANQTLYSDQFYQKPADNDDDEGDSEFSKEYKRVDLPTLLDEKPVSVEITRWKGFVRMKVNGHVPVIVQDGLARDGVIQVVGRVLIPKCKHHDGDHDHDGDDDHDDDDDDHDSKVLDIDLDDLKASLEPYLEDVVPAGSPQSDPFIPGDL